MAAPYTVGREVRDAADYTILFEGLTSAKLQEYAGREEEFFEEHPVSRIQIQGICPYGWHVANFQDWYDILYAAYDFGSKNNGGYVPKEPSFANTVYGSSSAAYKINVVPYLRISRALWTVGGQVPVGRGGQSLSRQRRFDDEEPGSGRYCGQLRRVRLQSGRLRGGGRCRWDGRIWG